MTTQNIEQIICELARQAYAAYPEFYNNESPEKTAENISELAAGYWRERNESEIERDEKAEVDINDYERWCASAYESYSKSVN